MEQDSRAAAFEILLLLADSDARWGDYRSALSLLESAAALAELPAEYVLKRRRWGRLHEVTRPRAAA